MEISLQAVVDQITVTSDEHQSFALDTNQAALLATNITSLIDSYQTDREQTIRQKTTGEVHGLNNDDLSKLYKSLQWINLPSTEIQIVSGIVRDALYVRATRK